MSEVIEFKRHKGIKLKFEGEEYLLKIPSLDVLLPLLQDDREKSLTENIEDQRKIFDLAGLPKEIYSDLTPAEHGQLWEIILGQVKKK